MKLCLFVLFSGSGSEDAAHRSSQENHAGPSAEPSLDRSERQPATATPHAARRRPRQGKILIITI